MVPTTMIVVPEEHFRCHHNSCSVAAAGLAEAPIVVAVVDPGC